MNVNMKVCLLMLSKFIDIRSCYNANKRLYPKADFVLVRERIEIGKEEQDKEKFAMLKILTSNISSRTTKEKVSE
jgi:hypothetical protein